MSRRVKVSYTPRPWMKEGINHVPLDPDFLRGERQQPVTFELRNPHAGELVNYDASTVLAYMRLLTQARKGKVHEPENRSAYREPSMMRVAPIGFVIGIEAMNLTTGEKGIPLDDYGREYALTLDDIFEEETGIVLVGRGGIYDLVEAEFPLTHYFEISLHPRLFDKLYWGATAWSHGYLREDDGSWKRVA